MPPTRKVRKTRRMRGAAKRKLKPTPLGRAKGRLRGAGWLPRPALCPQPHPRASMV